MYDGGTNSFLALRPSQPVKYWSALWTKASLRNKNKNQRSLNFPPKVTRKPKQCLENMFSLKYDSRVSSRAANRAAAHCVLEARWRSSEHHVPSCWPGSSLPLPHSSWPFHHTPLAGQSSRDASEPPSPPRSSAHWAWNSYYQQPLHWVLLWFK